MPSLAHRAVVLVLRLQRRKRVYQHPELLRARIAREEGSSFDPPRNLVKRVEIARRDVGDGTLRMPVFTLTPRARPRTKLRVVYLHGGAYVGEIDPAHWGFCARLAARIGCTVTVPIYPLAPRHGYKDVFSRIEPLYEALGREVGEGNLVLMGDSAGGGMALALAQRARERGFARARDVVLLSPWLDVTLDNPAIAAYEAADPWLARAGLVAAGAMYAQGDDPRTPRVSPAYGAAAGIGRVSIFMGTRDILAPDAAAFFARLAGDARGRYVEGAGMVHVWPLLPIPEAKVAMDAVVAILAG
jgi:acetyl esterase/lipase